MGTRATRSSWAKKPGLASCIWRRAAPSRRKRATLAALVSAIRAESGAVHPAEGLQVPAFVDDRDRDQCAYLGGALVCAGDDCLSLLER
jgi:hypothetical protein